MVKKIKFSIFVSILSFALMASSVFAGSATLNWNASTDNVGVTGYNIYYGTLARTGTQPGASGCGNCGYSTVVNVGNVTNYSFNNLTDGVRYYFSVSAYDTAGNESAFSGEVFKDIPAVASVSNITFSTQVEGISFAATRNFTIRILNTGTNNVVYQGAATTNASGNLFFSSIAIAAGAYDIIASSTSYLSKKTTVNLSSNNTFPLLKLLAGDLDNSNAIGAGDWSLMSPFFGTSNALADINDDNLVNSLDFGLMNKNWGQVGE